MWRRIIGGTTTFLILLASIREPIEGAIALLRLPDIWKAVMGGLTGTELWLWLHGVDPFMLALAFVVLYTTIIYPDIRPFLVKHLSRSTTGAFNEQFRALRFVDARMDFRLGMERAFTQYRRGQDVERGYGALVSLVDGVQFPDNFPPPDGRPLAEYLTTAAWPSDISLLADFLRDLFQDVPEVGTTAILPALEYQQLLRGYNLTAKFWDNAAREIIEGRLRAKAVARQIESNARDIVLVAMASLVLAEIVPWDAGGGSKSLFLLAQHKSKLQRERRWFRR